MRTRGWIKLGGVAMAMAFCVLFGVSLAAQGTERVNGPLVKASAETGKPRAYSAAPAGGTAAAAAKQQAPVKEKPEPAAPSGGDTGINRIGNKVGDLLQIAAYHGIRFIVSLFEALLG